MSLHRILSYKEHIHKVQNIRFGTISLGSYQIQNGDPRQQPSKQQLLHSATLRWNMCVMCGKRSTHVRKLDPARTEACHSITACLRQTSAENVYLLAGIAPPGVGRTTTYRQEIRKQTEDTMHFQYSHEPVNKRLKSRNSFVHYVTPLDKPLCLTT